MIDHDITDVPPHPRDERRAEAGRDLRRRRPRVLRALLRVRARRPRARVHARVRVGDGATDVRRVESRTRTSRSRRTFRPRSSSRNASISDCTRCSAGCARRRNWRRIAFELWPFVDGEPSTPMGEAESAWLETHARADSSAGAFTTRHFPVASNRDHGRRTHRTRARRRRGPSRVEPPRAPERALAIGHARDAGRARHGRCRPERARARHRGTRSRVLGRPRPRGDDREPRRGRSTKSSSRPACA